MKLNTAALRPHRSVWLLMILLFISGCKPQSEPLRVATHVWPGYEFLMLSRQLNFLPDTGITLTDSGSATQSIALLKQQQVDAATLTLDEVLMARSEGLALTIILVMDISVGADKIISRETIDSLAQLKGKAIGLEPTAVCRLLLTKASKQAGLSLNDFRLVPATIDQHYSLWQQGTVDAIVTYEPAATQILQASGQVIFDSSQVPETIVDVLAVRSDLIEDHAAMLQQLVSGFFRARKHFLTNPRDAAYRMSARLGVPSHEVMYLYQGLELPSLEHNRKLLDPANPQLSQVAAEIVQLELFPVDNPQQLTDELHSDAFLP